MWLLPVSIYTYLLYCAYFTYFKFHPRGYLSRHLAAISMAAVYTDAVHIADGVVGLKQRSLAASDPTA